MSWVIWKLIVLEVLVLKLLCRICRADSISAGEFSVEGCQLKEPVYDYLFNLTSLHSEFGHRNENEFGDQIEFNVCGPMSRKCGDQENVAACLTKKDGKTFVLGKTSKLNYNNGKIFFTFSGGDKCAGGKPYTLYISLQCDYTLDVEPFTVIQTEDADCTYYIKWETVFACLPPPKNMLSNTCTVADNKTGHTFDLMPLSDSNYRVSDRSGSFFIINVCKPVLYDQNAMCPADSGVCFINKNATNIKEKFINYGIAEPAPVFEAGQLKMNFQSNINCSEKENISSIIYFLCDPEAKSEMPEYIGKQGCKYEFSWLTTRACNNPKPCVALDPVSGKEYDLSPIADVYEVTLNGTTKQYKIGICKEVGPPCSENDGACEIIDSKSISLGKTLSIISVNDTGSPYVVYSSGSICDKYRNWTTRIEFICASDGLDERPKVIENTNCQLIIHVVTKYACKEKTQCKVSDSERTIDLTSLISNTENYVADVNQTLLKTDAKLKSVKFYLNVCRPLVSQYGLSCPGGSAACMATVKGSGTPEQEKSIGYPKNSLALRESQVQLRYTYGDTCEADKSERMSATVDFKCSLRAGMGRPMLQSIVKKCHYQFDWLTSTICPPVQGSYIAENCSVTNPGTRKSFNFRNAKFTNNGNITVPAKPKPFEIMMCGPNMDVLADYSESAMKLFFNTSGPCGVDGALNVQLRLICGLDTNTLTVYDHPWKVKLHFRHNSTPDTHLRCELHCMADEANTVQFPSPANVIFWIGNLACAAAAGLGVAISEWTAEQLRAAEEEIEQQKREWEVNRLAVLQKEEEIRREEPQDDEGITYSRDDAKKQVNQKLTFKQLSKEKSVSDAKRITKSGNTIRIKSLKRSLFITDESYCKRRRLLLRNQKLKQTSAHNAETKEKRLKREILKSSLISIVARSTKTKQVRFNRKAKRKLLALHSCAGNEDDDNSTKLSYQSSRSPQNFSECSLDVMIDSNDATTETICNNRNNEKLVSYHLNNSDDSSDASSDTAANKTNVFENYVDVNSPRTRSRGSVKINLWTLDISPILPGVRPINSECIKKSTDASDFINLNANKLHDDSEASYNSQHSKQHFRVKDQIRSSKQIDEVQKIHVAQDLSNELIISEANNTREAKESL